MATRVEADVDVQRFGYAGDEKGRRLLFPHAHLKEIEGKTGATRYGAADCAFEGLEGRLGTLYWEAQAASIGSGFVRDDGGRFDLTAERTEFPHGLRLVRGDAGVEILSPHVSFSELRLGVKGPFVRGQTADEQSIASAGGAGTRRATAPSAAPPGLRQEKLRFLDSLSGRIYLTVKVQLDLPVLGVRTLDQQLRVPVQEGSLDYRALDDSIDWLEGQFLDIKLDDQRLRVQWKVPIFGASHDLISWAMDTDASTLAAFGRVPIRSLADFRIGGGATPKAGDDKKRKVLQAFTLDAIDIALSLLAPRNVEVGGGMILFGGEDQPGIVDLKVTGAVRDRGAGALRGAIGSIDTTIKDLRLGPMVLTADRLHFDGLDNLEVTFEGFRPTAVTMVVHRVTATNLAMTIGR